MNIGKRIYEARCTRNLTQVDFADMLGVSQKDVSRWETGERVPNVESLAKICSILCFSADFFMDIPDFESQRYIVIDNALDTETTYVFKTPFEANRHAQMLWNHLTLKEQKNRRIYAQLVTRSDLDFKQLGYDEEDIKELSEVDYWTCYYGTNDFEGCFDSDNLKEND